MDRLIFKNLHVGCTGVESDTSLLFQVSRSSCCARFHVPVVPYRFWGGPSLVMAGWLAGCSGLKAQGCSRERARDKGDEKDHCAPLIASHELSNTHIAGCNCLRMFARRLQPSNLIQTSFPLRNAVLRQFHFSQPSPPLQTFRFRAPLKNPKRAAIEPVAFALAFTLSFAAAYALDRYTQNHTPIDPIETSLLHQDDHSLALQAQKYPDVMAAQQAPGRPGNLTAEEEVKLKEMWAQTFEIFGVSR